MSPTVFQVEDSRALRRQAAFRMAPCRESWACANFIAILTDVCNLAAGGPGGDKGGARFAEYVEDAKTSCSPLSLS